MAYREPDLAGAMALLYNNKAGVITGVHKWNANAAAELAAVVAALGSDNTTHDQTIETRAPALTIGVTQTRLTNDVLLLVNEAKGGNLSNLQIISAIDDAVGVAHAPAVIDTPYASANAKPPIIGTVCSVTTGNWTGSPTSYAYAWKRDGANIGATAATYTLVAADIGGHLITCVVTATNATGSTPAPPSNAIST